jgi:hypothetical protein
MSEEREKARAQDPKHWVVVQSYLKERVNELTDWEVDFLHSVKWSENLTKAQSASLKAISDKMQSTEHIGKKVVVVKKGTPEYAAWIAHKRASGQRTEFLEKLPEMTVPTLWPEKEKAA